MRLPNYGVIASLLLLSTALPLLGDDDTVFWHSDYKEALEIARQTHKPIFLEYRCEP